VCLCVFMCVFVCVCELEGVHTRGSLSGQGALSVPSGLPSDTWPVSLPQQRHAAPLRMGQSRYSVPQAMSATFSALAMWPRASPTEGSASSSAGRQVSVCTPSLVPGPAPELLPTTPMPSSFFGVLPHWHMARFSIQQTGCDTQLCVLCLGDLGVHFVISF
jgi:hypothetical protein